MTGGHQIVDGPRSDGPDIVCDEPPRAPCRVRCPTMQCTSWATDSPCPHGPLIDGPCLAVDGIYGHGVEDAGPDDDWSGAVYDEEGVVVHRGPVVVEWTGEVWTWALPAGAT